MHARKRVGWRREDAALVRRFRILSRRASWSQPEPERPHHSHVSVADSGPAAPRPSGLHRGDRDPRRALPAEFLQKGARWIETEFYKYEVIQRRREGAVQIVRYDNVHRQEGHPDGHHRTVHHGLDHTAAYLIPAGSAGSSRRTLALGGIEMDIQGAPGSVTTG